MNGFLGEYEVTLDAKGRFLLPASLKKQTGEDAGSFVINRGFEKCLGLYPMKSWEPIFEEISKLNDFDPKVRSFRRYFLNGATMMELDSAGRLLIPQNLKEHAGLEKDIVLVTAVNKIEIWDKVRYQQFFETFSPDDFSGLANEVMNGKSDKLNHMRDTNPEYHMPVLLSEAMDGLNIRASGVFVDCTFGGGGHSAEILSHLNAEGRLFGFDQDADAKRNSLPDERFIFIPHNFRHIQRFLRLHGVTSVDGILADLGVSSHQFDEPARGFSTRFEANLDMRMDIRQSLTAESILNTYGEHKLQEIFSMYGEVTNAKTLAKAIVTLRNKTPFHTVNGFKQTIADLVKGNPNRYFAQVFQALRIEVNDETGALREMLEQVPALLKPGGRIAIISFHSLEDRIVKLFFRNGNFEEKDEMDPYGSSPNTTPFRTITKKPITPLEKEVIRNPRARSAKLRIAEKI